VPVAITGSVLGYAVSSQFVGQVAGPVAGGFIGGHFGMRAVFFGTCVLIGLGALVNWIIMSRLRAERA
jgi:MFS family permease